MSKSKGVLRGGAAVALALVLLNICPAVLAQQRRTRARTHTPPRATTVPPQRRTTPARPATTSAADARMTGVYLLNTSLSTDPYTTAERATTHLAPDERERVLSELAERLSSPGQIAIRRRGQAIDLASTRAPRVTFVADGVTHTERAPDGRTLRSRAAVYGDSLMISSSGESADEFSVNLDVLDRGRRLRVTRRVTDSRLGRPVIVQSMYDKTSDVARFTVYGEPVPQSVARGREERAEGRVPPRPQPREEQQQQQPRPQPPVIRRNDPPRPADDPFTGFYIGEDARFVAVLENDLSTQTTREGDPFTMIVRSPDGFEGAVIEGRVARVNRGGRVSGRAEMELQVERIRLRDGRTQQVAGFIEEVNPTGGGEQVRVDNEAEGSIQEGDSPTSRTTQRVAIGAAVGALIGAIAGGGKGAGIGAAVGAAAGAGSVYAQGRDHLELRRGSEIVLSLRPRENW
ncbi:MAG TPA: YMGG-like glycine zipper-containing protein [Pyrinomonadaceae bacterium]|nr:YMGG-like glycine zipper-containing protein [Pyrinomonadaceae bacterium]